MRGKARTVRAVQRWRNRARELESLLLMLYSRTDDVWVKSRIATEFYGTTDDKQSITKLRFDRTSSGTYRLLEREHAQ